MTIIRPSSLYVDGVEIWNISLQRLPCVILPAIGLAMVNCVPEHHVGYPDSNCKPGKGLEEVTRLDFFLRIFGCQPCRDSSPTQTRPRKEVRIPAHVIRGEQIHVLAALGKLKSDVGITTPKPVGLDTNLSSAFSRLVSRNLMMSG